MRAVLCGYYGKGNAGDEALLASLLQMLPSSVQPVVLSGNPAETRRRYGVESCDRMKTASIIKALRRSEVFIWGGGSLMQDATSAANPVYYGGMMGLARQLGLKTIAWGQGIGPLQRPLTRWIARQAFAGCSAVSVRDRGSAEILTNWQIPFTIAPDPVWALEGKPVQELADLPFPRVAVTWRSHPQLTPARLACLTQALVDFQKITQTCILLVPFQASQDLAIAQSIQSQLTGANHLVTIEDPRELKGVFQGVDMAIGMRLHSLILAAAAQCRCFGLSYDPKVTQLMAELDLPGWQLAEIPTEPQQICQAWLEHYQKGDRLSTARLQFLVERALIHQDLLAASMV